MDESNRVPLENVRSRDQMSMGQHHGSPMGSRRRSSVSLESTMRYTAHEQQVIEGTFMTDDHNPTQFYPLLPGESGVTTPDHSQTQNAQQISESGGSIKSKKSIQSKVRPKSTHTWRLEVGAAILSMCAMVVLIVLLAHANGRPLDEWRFFISFNALISILGAIARAPLGFAMGSCLGQAKWNWFRKRSDSLLAFEKFEDASRGPMGSLTLLFWLNIRHWSSLGALMTIILLGVEPFLQAIVDYNGRLDMSARLTPPIIGTSHRLDVGAYAVADDGGGTKGFILSSGEEITGPGFYTLPDVGMTAALIKGLYNETTNLESTASFLCPSGNCTWTPYATLAICSRCNDVTSLLERNSSYGDSSHVTINRPNQLITANYTGYTLPYVSLSNFDTGKLFPAYMAAAAVSNPGLTVSFQEDNTLIAAVAIIRAASVYNGSNWSDTPVRATECALSFCTSAYSARVDNGILTESVLGSWSNRDLSSYAYVPSHLWTMSDEKFQVYEDYNNHSLRNTAFDFARSDLQLRITKDEAIEKNLPPDATLLFNISQSAVESISYSFTDQLFTAGQVTWPYPSWVTNPDARIKGILDPLIAQALGTIQTEDYPVFFENMAHTVTSFMRDYSNTTQIGAQNEWVIHIRVQWEYLILPALVIVGSCLVLLFTMLETKFRRVEPWKSDVLATFIHSIDAEIRERLKTDDSKGQARHLAKNMVVDLVDLGDTIELKVKKD